MTEELREQRVKAIEETAFAYLRRGDRVQYDSSNLTYVDRFRNGGPHRRTDPVSPEGATKDSYMFTVCSSFGYNVLKNAFGFDMCGSSLRHTCRAVLEQYSRFAKFSYDRENPGDLKEKASYRATLEALKPGDIFVVETDTGYHFMICISEERVIHSGGIKINMETGEEKWDSPGSIRVDTLAELALSVLGMMPFSKLKRWWVIDILAAIDAEKYPITPWAQSRLDYPGLDIDRVASVRRYQTVQPGDTITITLQLHNVNTRKSKICYEGLEIEEHIPPHTTLLESSVTADTVLEGDTLRWKMNFRQGEERIIQYTVRVNDDVQPGTELVLPAGKVANIPTCEIRRLVSAPRPTLDTLGKISEYGKTVQDAEALYKKLGKDVKIPTAWEMITGLYEFYEEDDVYEHFEKKHIVLRDKAEKDAAALEAMQMAVPDLIGGKLLVCVPTAKRVLELRGENLHPGDVILVAREATLEGCKEEQWTILGGGKALVCKDGKSEVIDLPYMDILLATDYFIVLRPYLTTTI